MSEGITIGRLETSARKWARKWGAKNFESYRCGNGCSHHFEPSHVRVTFDKGSVVFMANGHGVLNGPEIGGLSSTWCDMKAEAERRLRLSPNT